MKFRLLLITFICLGNIAWDAPSTEAGWRNGRRAYRGRTYSRQRSSRTRSYRTTSSQNKPHLTRSRSAFLDGFFNAGMGGGHDQSWYVGK